MSIHKKLQDSMRQGVILERDRCMRILFRLADETRKGLNRKLMTAGEKHLAELRLKIAEGVIAAAQIKIMSGEDPDAPKDLHARDADPLRGPQGNADGPSAS